MSFYVIYPSGGSGGGGVTTLNGLSGAVTLAAGTNVTLVPAGNTITINASGGSGANQQLSNLSAVEINSSLLFDIDNTYTVGSPSEQAATIYSHFMEMYDAAAYLYLDNNLGQYIQAYMFTQTLAGVSVDSAVESGGNTALFSADGGDVLVFSQNDTGSGNIHIGSDDAGVDNSGNVNIFTGTSSGTRGQISMRDGSEGTSGDVWTSTGTAGEGAWATPAAAGANTALSNLAAVDLNQDLTTTKASNLLLSHQAATFAVNVLTADNGAGNSGAVTLQTGTASGTRGDINLNARQTNFTGSLLPSAAATYAVGSTALRLADVVTERVQVRDGIDRVQMILNGQAPSVGTGTFNAVAAGVGQNLAIYSRSNNSGASGPVYLESGNNDASTGSTNTGLVHLGTGAVTNAGNAGNSGSVSLSTGNVAGAGDSGSLSLSTGTSASGSRGAISFQDWFNVSITDALTSTWAAAIPAFISDGTSAEAIAATASAIMHDGDSTVDFFVSTRDGEGGDTGSTSRLLLTTGYGTTGQASGNLIILTGESDTASGSIVIGTGSGGGTRGNILLDGLNTSVQGPLIMVNDVVQLYSAAADPAGTAGGQLYYNSVSNKIKMYNGATWETVTSV